MDLIDYLMKQQDYRAVRQLPDGRIIGVQQMAFTAGLMVDMDATGYAYRYCYRSVRDAIAAWELWGGNDDPPGPWIKIKGAGEERLGPGATS